MGFFKDIHKLEKQAKEIDKTWDPGAQAREGVERMKAMNAQMASANAALAAPPQDAIEASATVTAVGNPTGMMNMDPILPVEFLVLQPGLPPRPASVSVIVPLQQMSRVVVGATLPVRISRTDPNAMAVEWALPA
jgi:hypothetical protein